jgi:hypothetical protein
VNKSDDDRKPITLFQPGPLGGSLVASRNLPYIYVNNPKCGCSTVRRTLWAAEHALGLVGAPGHPHELQAQLPFDSGTQCWDRDEPQFVFTFVRNPYARVLSAYLDKAVGFRDPNVWVHFAARHGLGQDDEPSFGEFLNLIAAESPERMDPHWRPQTYATGIGVVPYDFVGALETFEEDLRFVIRRVFGHQMPIDAFMGHKTGAAQQIAKYYGRAEKALVQRIYEIDFAELGYGTRLDHPERRSIARRPRGEPLRVWAKALRLYGESNFDAAAQLLESVRREIRGPVVDAKLRRCYATLAVQHANSDRDRQIHYLDRMLALPPDDANSWKECSKTLQTLGRRECSVEAAVQAIGALRPGPGSERRYRRWRRLIRTLAFLRARQGRRKEALATLQTPRPITMPGRKGFAGVVDTMADYGAWAMVQGLGVVAMVLRPIRVTPDAGPTSSLADVPSMGHNTLVSRQEQQIEMAYSEP